MLKLGHAHPVLCAVVYEQRQYNKDFNNNNNKDPFLARVIPKHDVC